MKSKVYYTEILGNKERIVLVKRCFQADFTGVQTNITATLNSKGKIYANSRVEAEMILNQRGIYE